MSTSIDERVSGLPTDLEDGKSVNEDKPSITTGLDSKRHSVESRLKAEEVILRQAILGVIDDGWQCEKANGLARGELTECNLLHPWEFGFYFPERDKDNQQRLNFADAVLNRIRQIQSEPFNLGTKLENYCPRHIRERLPASTATVCADCMAEREEKK